MPKLSRLHLPALIVIFSLSIASSGLAQTLDADAVFLQLQKGGRTMWFLGFLSVVMLAFALERLLRLRRGRIAPPKLAREARRLWDEGRYDEIIRFCDKDDSVLARVIRVIVVYRQGSLQDVRTIAGDVGANELRPHYRRLQPLAVVAVLAPLLGLFGTVIGMIAAFEDFRLLGETGDPTVFAGSISKALVTTATGLIIAMPALALFHYFKSRTNAYADSLESHLQELTLAWFVKRDQAEAPAASSAPAGTAAQTPVAAHQ